MSPLYPADHILVFIVSGLGLSEWDSEEYLLSPAQIYWAPLEWKEYT